MGPGAAHGVFKYLGTSDGSCSDYREQVGNLKDEEEEE
jgi:hypothetical protein